MSHELHFSSLWLQEHNGAEVSTPSPKAHILGKRPGKNNTACVFDQNCEK